MLWVYLSLSVAGVAAGVVYALVSMRRPRAIAVLRGFAIGSIGVIVLMRMVPHVYEELGAHGLLLMVLGFYVMGFAERWSHAEGPATIGPTRFNAAELALVGLCVHSAGDGLALVSAANAHGQGNAIAMAVIAHQLPVSAVLTYVFVQRGNRFEAAWRLTALALSTVVGAVFGNAIITHYFLTLSSGLTAVVAGTLLHVVAHDFMSPDERHAQDRHYETAGFVAGILIASMAPGLEAHGHEGAETLHHLTMTIRELSLAVAMPLLGGLLLAGVMQIRVDVVARAKVPAGRARQIGRGLVLGTLLPICRCGTVPVASRLFHAKVPPTFVLAFLLSAAGFGMDSLFVSVRLLGWQFTVLRVLLVGSLAALLALLFGRSAPLHEERFELPLTAADLGYDPRVPKVRRVLTYAFGELIDHLGPLLVFGIGISAAADLLLSGSGAAAWTHRALWILPALGVPLYVCASSVAPFAAVLVAHHFSPGTALAFLIVGPMFNAASLHALSRDWHRQRTLLLAVVAYLIAVSSGWVADHLAGVALSSSFPQLGTPSVIDWVSLAILGGLMAFSLLQQGAVLWSNAIVEVALGYEHTHGHHHHHHHHTHHLDLCAEGHEHLLTEGRHGDDSGAV